MYRMIKAESNDGIDKLDEIKKNHSLEGFFWMQPFVGVPFLFQYNDNSGKTRQSSTVREVVTVNNQMRIITNNTEYVFEKVEE